MLLGQYSGHLPSPLRQRRRFAQYVLVQPNRTLAGTRSHGLEGQLLVIVVEYFKTVITTVANSVKTQHLISQLLAVHTLARKNPKGAGGGHAFFKGRGFLPHEIGQLDKKNF